MKKFFLAPEKFNLEGNNFVYDGSLVSFIDVF